MLRNPIFVIFQGGGGGGGGSGALSPPPSGSTHATVYHSHHCITPRYNMELEVIWPYCNAPKFSTVGFYKGIIAGNLMVILLLFLCKIVPLNTLITQSIHSAIK